MKTAKEYYLDAADGVRILACSIAMLAVIGGRFVVSKIRDSYSKEKGSKDKEPKNAANGADVEDATIVDEPGR